MNFKEQLNGKAAAIESVISQYLPEETGLQKTIFSAMNYANVINRKVTI